MDQRAGDPAWRTFHYAAAPTRLMATAARDLAVGGLASRQPEPGTMFPPDVAFQAQQAGATARGGEVLRRLLVDADITELTVVVAWAKYRGLARLETELRDFGRRGKSRIIVGIDEGGGTKPGLLAAHELFDDAFVFHEYGAGTFHPKIYLAEGPSKAVLLVGSSNLTPGGLFLNHEASVELGFALPSEKDHAALADAKAYIQRLLDDTDVCRAITPALVDELADDRRVRLSLDEEQRPRGTVPLPTGSQGEDLDPGASDATLGDRVPVFGRSRHPTLPVPKLGDGAKARLRGFATAAAATTGAATPASGTTGTTAPASAAPASGTTGTTAPASAAPASGTTGATAPASAAPASGTTASAGTPATRATVVREWSKKLTRSDAQQQHRIKPNTRATGALRLTKAGHDIDWITFFRSQLFAPASWAKHTSRKGHPVETAVIPMDVSVGGSFMGTLSFRVSDAPHRASTKGSHSTVLHWDGLMPTLLATDHTDDLLTISRMSDGTYRLEIS